MDRVLEKAIETYGKENQVDVAIEEMSELTKALTKMNRCLRSGKGDYNYFRVAIAEEIADVEVMLEQLKMIYNCTEAVMGIKALKMTRLEARLGMREFKERLDEESEEEN